MHLSRQRRPAFRGVVYVHRELETFRYIMSHRNGARQHKCNTIVGPREGTLMGRGDPTISVLELTYKLTPRTWARLIGSIAAALFNHKAVQVYCSNLGAVVLHSRCHHRVCGSVEFNHVGLEPCWVKALERSTCAGAVVSGMAHVNINKTAALLPTPERRN